MRATAKTLLIAALLAGCASQPSPPPQQPTGADQAPAAKPSMTNRVGGAAATPLHDVNLVRTKIPPALLDAADAPYARPRPLTCLEIAAEIAPLDVALGPDLDHPVNPKNPGLLQRGQGLADDVAVDAVRSAAEGVIPMRSWVRMLTGAQRHDRLVAAAIAAGGVRRAYLKGLGVNEHCPPPAQPLAAAQDAVPGAGPLHKAATANKW
jgi:hypothetical protein